jgi:hypothetical protein
MVSNLCYDPGNEECDLVESSEWRVRCAACGIAFPSAKVPVNHWFSRDIAGHTFAKNGDDKIVTDTVQELHISRSEALDIGGGVLPPSPNASRGYRM